MPQASFHKPELASLEHQFDMPDVPQPEALPTSEARYQTMLQGELAPIVR